MHRAVQERRGLGKRQRCPGPRSPSFEPMLSEGSGLLILLSWGRIVLPQSHTKAKTNDEKEETLRQFWGALD